MIAVSDRIVRAFISSEATPRAVAHDIQVFDRIWYAGFLHKLKSCGFQVRYLALFCLFSVIDGFGGGVLYGKSSQKYVAVILQGSILASTLFLLYINDLFNDVIFNFAMQMILLSAVSWISHLICGYN